MSTQLKNSEPAGSDKPSRRGAAGRAAALRRAPSDSDCSGETASLSADSGERRPPPPPPRGKSRNRRRGSEWEVLEGLKDGQRFERRPEVFNGFLHKKRKWPLKGWHKRFFVVDGGILVYARSPTDVARGRLHGSLDVGLSVISAKPRRRRIDIDADEFIYHLRAKTPDVFRTWLNVLKAHRLYRQHLLTFGARESVPKIHAPLDDLPPTDNSSRVSLSSVESFSSLTLSKTDPKDYFPLTLSEFNSSVYYMKSKSTWMTDDSRPSEQSDPSSSMTATRAPVSLCSTHCIEKRQRTKHDSYKKLPVIPLAEQQIHCTDLDLNTLNSSSLGAKTSYINPNSISSTKNYSFNANSFRTADQRESKSPRKINTHYNTIACEQSPKWLSKKDQAALFCFSRKQKSGSKSSDEWDMRRSRKCTNLVKYRNVGEEPCLKKPLQKKMLLNKYNHNVFARLEEKIVCPVKTVKSIRDKATQDTISPSECDVISERLIFNLFDKTDNDKDKQSSVYVNCVVKELYDLKFTDSDRHPIKVLFKCLLQYYLKNTKGTFKGSVKRDVGSVTSRHHTSDKEVQTKETLLSPSNAQNLESVLNSTIYGCSVIPGKTRENDIEITKMLRDNIDKISKSDHNNTAHSSELSRLQEYIKHIMREASIPNSVAKDFLNVYLDVLGHCSPSDTSLASSEFSRESNVNNPVCNIQAESIRKKISRSISCSKKPSIDGNMNQGVTKTINQLNLKDIVDKMIGLFTCNNEETRPSNVSDNIITNNAPKIDQLAFTNAFMRDNTVVMDLSKYEFHNIFWCKNATALGTSSITINLKDKTTKSDEAKLKSLSLQFSNDISKKIGESDVTYTKYNPNKSNDVSPKNADNSQVPSISSEATSKGNLPAESDLYVNMLNDNSKLSKNMPFPKCSQNTQCYLVSSIINDVPLMEDRIKSLKDLHGFTPASYSRKSRIIDEELIFRALESLVAISKDIVGINEEISNLHLNLKKRYAKFTKHFPGRDFLGSIYGKVYNDEATDINSYTGNHEEALEIAVNTSFVFPNYERKDQALSAIVFSKTMPDVEDETLRTDNDETKTKSPNIYRCPELKNDEKEQWFKGITQKYIESTAIKCMLKKYHNLPQSIRVAHPIKAKIAEKLGVPQNSSMMVESTTSSPPLTNSIGTQKIKEINMEMKVNRSESATDLSVCNVHNDMSDELKTIYRCASEPSYCSESGGPLETASRELGQAQLSVQQLQRLLDAMLEAQHNMHHDADVSVDGASPNVKKDRRKFGLRKKKSNSKCASVELAPPNVDSSISHMALSALTAPPSPGGGSSSMPNSAASLPIACAAARPQSLPGAEALGVNAGGPTSLTSLTPDHQLREDFTILAKDLVSNLKTVVSTLVVERGRLQAAMAATEPPAAGGVVAALRTNLTSALQQNSELRSRLSRIHDASDLAEISSVGNNSDQQVTRPFPQSLSYSSSCVSASEFFDAEEHEESKPTEIIATDEAGVIELDGDSSSEAGSLSSEEGEGSASSDNSDGATSAVIPAERTPIQNGGQICMRRSRLPCPRPTPASPSLWNLLYKNIGKDLSQISMPVTINEPLNMLQRLCEELEYSSLLDSASSCSNEVERMSLIAAFAVSAYAASAHRAASKPFNPLLAETYEYVCGDRGFRFIAEQVSHHPPISACHAESPRWTFWQEARIKTKFWGKSMEFQPTGRVHVRLTPSGDHYSWNKVTTCVHNLFGGQRWVDQYGDMHITCHGTDINCKLQFIKASSWSSSRHEVRGVVAVGGSPRLRLQGRWSEGLQGGDRTLWRPGAMPADYELYYGFTRFAMELNELEPGMRDVLPSTDTRLRPDQRALEEGDVDAAEQFKLEVEQAQRERRRDGVEYTPQWFRKTMEDGEETWVFTGSYWKAREAGFDRTPRLW